MYQFSELQAAADLIYQWGLNNVVCLPAEIAYWIKDLLLVIFA